MVAEGKVYVNGGFWDVIRFPAYPQVLPVAVVAVLRVPYRAYHQDHKFEVTMEDADARDVLLRVEGQFRVGSSAEMRVGDPSILPMAMLGQVAIPRPGDFSFILRVDGGELARYPFRALQVAAPMEMPGPPADLPGGH